MRDGFVLTTDMLLALAMLVSLLSVFASLEANVAQQKFQGLENYARDYLVLKYSFGTAAAAPGVAITEDYASIAAGAQPVLAAQAFVYPKACGCASYPCYVASGSACLTAQDAGMYNYSYSAWVYPT